MQQECDLEEGVELHALVDGAARNVGTCPSVAWSYGLSCWLGLASVQSDQFKGDRDYFIQAGGRDVKCQRTELPFVNFDRYRAVPASLG